MLTQRTNHCLINSIYLSEFRHLGRRFFQNLKRDRNHKLEAIHEPAIPNPISNYDTSQTEKLLQIINSFSMKELIKYEISKSRAQKLQTWREKNGNFNKIEDVLQIDGIGVKVLEKLCRSLLSGVPKKEKSTENTIRVSKRVAPFVTPSVADFQQLKSIRSCLSLRIGVSSVTWARLELSSGNNPCQLTNWEHQDIIDKKIHISDLMHRCWLISRQIPNADCYIFENPQTVPISSNKNAEQQNISIQKSQITAALSYDVFSRDAKDNESESVPKVFYVRRFLSARLFNHLVGTERVSSEETVTNLMRTHFNVEDNKYSVDLSVKLQDATKEKEDNQNCDMLPIRGEVQFSEDIRDMYSKSSRYHREFLGQALLLNLTFVRLVLLQDPNSIAIASKNLKRLKGPSNLVPLK